MAIEHSITFGGVNSADFGIYISGEGVFNAPKRDVEMISIPGRNGEIALDKGRYENIEVTYPAFNYEADYSDFAQNLADFRNAICSRIGYQRLSDTFHPDEYRMATYIDGLEIKPIKYNTASEFEITFNCKPQRWLTSGEAPVTIGEWGETETVSGDIVQIENDGSLGVKSLTASIEPIQDLHGYDKPWSGGGGKNKLEITQGSETINGITYTVNADGTVTASGTATSTSIKYLAHALQGGHLAQNLANYIGQSVLASGCPSGGGASTYRLAFARLNGSTFVDDYGNGGTTTVADLTGVNAYVRIQIESGVTVNNLVFEPMIRLTSETDATFAPYSNICPISGHTECVTSVSPTTSEQDATTYTTSLGRTVYGGTLDVVSGVLTVTRTYVGGSDWTYFRSNNGFKAYKIENAPFAVAASPTEQGAISNAIGTFGAFSSTVMTENIIQPPSTAHNIAYMALDENVDASTVFLCYLVKEPQTYQLTPTEVELLLGTNNLWTDAGDISVEIGLNPDILFNPTQYEARPLLAVTGDGTIDLAGQTIELIHQDLGDVDLFGAETKESPIGSNASATAYTFVLGTTDYFPSALLNQSDEITIRGATVGLRCDHNTRITAGSGTGIDGVTTRVGSSSIAWDFPDITIGFKDGTTYQAYTNNDVRVKNRRTGVTYTYRMTVQFKAPQYASGGQVQIEVTLHKSSADPIWVKTGSASWQSVTAYSTASGLGNPTYIDCDLGEAYMYIGDDLYSLNGNIDLGSDVPVLKEGVNEITYDNTITDLKITPRWWKL